jgi:hypothetical protein
MSPDRPDLATRLEAFADGLGGIERRMAPDGVELVRGGRHFATLSGSSASFRLDRSVAAAALHTPDTTGSALGPEWVTFGPPVVDGFAEDRATAWLELAWRRVGPTD